MTPEFFRPQINHNPLFPNPKLLDVTLRDGSFAVNFKWQESSIRYIVHALAKAGFSFIELGYYGGMSDLQKIHGIDSAGITSDFPLSFAQELTSEYPDVNFALMIHPTGLNNQPDFKKIKQAGVSLVRFVYLPNWWDKLEKYIPEAIDHGLSVSINLVCSSRYSFDEIEKTCMKMVANFSPNIIYLADTCSAFYPNQLKEIYSYLPRVIDTSLGFHAHDFMSLAFANSLVAAQSGATYIDSSILGIGRGAGNLRSELWCIAAVAQGNQQYHLEPLLPAIAEIGKYRNIPQAKDMLSQTVGAYNLVPPEDELLHKIAQDQGLTESVAACRFSQHWDKIQNNFHLIEELL